MRIGFIGVSHWHSAHFLHAVAARADDTIVGVADAAPGYADRWASELGTDAYSDHRLMCEKTKPDLVIVLGRPADMAATAEYLIESDLPVMMEKPAGVNVAEVRRVKELVDAKQAFFTVPFPLRFGRLARLVAEHSPGEELTYASFRAWSGTPGRYRQSGLDWNLDPALAGGGCTLNIGSLYLEFARYLAPSARWQVKSASMSSTLGGIDVEDVSSVLLESEGRRAIIQTGYVFPRQQGEEGVDVSVALCVGSRYYRMVMPNQILVRDESGAEQSYESGMTQSPWYPNYIDDVIASLRAGTPPTVTIDDMLEVAQLAESAYRQTEFDACMRAPRQETV